MPASTQARGTVSATGNGGPKVSRWLIIPVILAVAINSGFSWVAMVVAACGFSSCEPDVWQTTGPYISLVAGVGAAVVSGSLLAFVRWARPRTRFVVGGVAALAWLAYTAWLALSLT